MPSPSSPSSPRRRTKRLKRVPSFGGDKNYLIGVGFGLFALAVFGAIYLVSYQVAVFMHALFEGSTYIIMMRRLYISLYIDALLSFSYMLYIIILYMSASRRSKGWQ